MIKRIFITLSFFLFSSTICADLSEDIDDFLRKYNSPQVNVTKGEIYQSQKAGHITAGGLTIRNQIISSKPLTVTMPKIDAGCGGIDLYTGAFSYINSEEIINTMKSIASSAQGYAFLLALETVSPQMANNIRYLQDMANKVNSMNINSCELASQLVGAAWPKESIADEHICRTLKSQRGLFSDWVAGRRHCSDLKNKVDNKEEVKSPGLLGNEYNISWEALKKQSFFNGGKEKAELFLTLLGTVIKRFNANGEYEHEYLPSKINDESFLKSILEGGKVALYECKGNKDDKCLFPKEIVYELPFERSLNGRVRSTIFAIQRKILLDEELNDEEKSLIESTRYPIFKWINVITAVAKERSIAQIYNIADLITIDVLLQCVRDAIKAARDGCEQLRATQFYDGQCDAYLKHLDVVENKVVYYEMRCTDQLEKELQIDQLLRMLEEDASRKVKISN